MGALQEYKTEAGAILMRNEVSVHSITGTYNSEREQNKLSPFFQA
jgi:hypothetical protein